MVTVPAGAPAPVEVMAPVTVTFAPGATGVGLVVTAQAANGTFTSRLPGAGQPQARSWRTRTIMYSSHGVRHTNRSVRGAVRSVRAVHSVHEQLHSLVAEALSRHTGGAGGGMHIKPLGKPCPGRRTKDGRGCARDAKGERGQRGGAREAGAGDVHKGHVGDAHLSTRGCPRASACLMRRHL